MLHFWTPLVIPAEIFIVFFILQSFSVTLLLFHKCLCPFLILRPTLFLTFMLFCMSSVLIHSLREWVISYLQGFKWCDYNCMFWEILVLRIKHLSSFLSETRDPPRLPLCSSLPTELATGRGNKKQEKPKAHKKLLSEAHCTPHSGTIKYGLFTWNAVNRFSKEHKPLVVSWKCFCVLPEICTLNLILQRMKNIPFGHIVSYTVLQTLLYIIIYFLLHYYCYITVLTDSNVYHVFKPVRK